MERRHFLRGTLLAALGGGVVACASTSDAGSAATAVSPSAEPTAPSAIDVGFCTDMSFHHEQAVAMCQRVLGRYTGDAVQASAAEILQNQSYERGLMHAWLASWGESTAPPTEVMGWMGMAMDAQSMPGLATQEEMAELADLEGLAKGKRFLELMRAHHEGGVHMADAAGEANTPEVRRAARQMAATQTYEISVFDQLLATTYADV